MTPAQWREVKDLFHAAREQAAETRHTFLVRACSDEIVRAEVERLLAEFSRAGDFLSRPGTASDGAFTSGPFDFGADFAGTSRFIVQERLGSGTFGVVYRVFDQERNSEVALKKLRGFHPSHLLRFKQEFRGLVDLVHPNLVQLYELFGEDGEWFFTMELVHGAEFLAYVRPGKILGSWDRLRDAVFQLSLGVQALHSFSRLHRDLKPSNVLVSAEGRVTILDFGLVQDSESEPDGRPLVLAGSPAYMAPEQAACAPLGEAADWYAVGVMLYSAITGRLPFPGTGDEILARKQRELPPPAVELNPDVPKDLDEACQSLLQRDPAKRSRGAEILLSQRSGAGINRPGGREEFVGREIELTLLKERFARLSSGFGQTVFLQGKSGIGKTSLLSHFLDGLRRNFPGAVILKGRCRESESLPYKALDPIADELVRYLQSLPEPIGTALLPSRPEMLRRLFPVFGDLGMLTGFPDQPLAHLDEQQIRRRAFEALSGLLGRMSDRTPVVISIDDLQWSDLDSIAFIVELVLAANPLPLLLVLSFRSEDAEGNPSLKALRSGQQRLTDAGSCLDIELRGLSESEGRALLNHLQAPDVSLTEDQTREILQEADGSPLLLNELLLFISSQIKSGGTVRLMESVLVSDMIRHRAGTFSPVARQLLEVLSVAGEPVSKTLLYQAVSTAGEDPAKETGLLVREHLVRLTGGARGARLEPFHDQVREASLSWLTPAELQTWHSRLAHLLQSEADMDPQRLLRHYRGAGNSPAAFQAAVAAGSNAEGALAFEQAARFYAEALETGEAGDSAQASLHRKRAEALAKAGRGYESGQSYKEAARWPAYNDTIDMRRAAAEQLIRSGHLDEGTLLFTELLRNSGIHIPANRKETLLRMLVLRAFIRMRGLKWRERSETEIPAAALRKLDLLWSGAMALMPIDTISGSYLQALHMRAALHAGEPSRLALSFSFAAIYECMGGTREYPHGRRLIGLAQELAGRQKDRYLMAMTYGCWAGLDFLSGRVKDGLVHSGTALADLDLSSAWESGTFNMARIWFLAWGGRIRELTDTLPKLVDEGRSRGDVYTEVSLRCSGTSHLVELAADNPEYALAGIARCLNQWRKTSYDLPHLHATISRVECLLYAGRFEQARELLLSDWEAISRSLYTRKSQIHRTILFYLRGRTALVEWMRDTSSRELRSEIEELAKRLLRLKSLWGKAFSILLHAGIMAGLERPEDAIVPLVQAEVILREQDLQLMSAAVSRRRGELEGAAGAGRIAAADAFMRSENILRPDRMTAMILPRAPARQEAG